MICPNGHDSAAADYCDQCGIRMTASSPAVPGGAAPGGPGAGGPAGDAPATVPPSVAPGDCPNCGAPRSGGERFCEVCGLDFDTGRLPQAPTATAAPAADPAPAGSAVPEAPAIGWVAVVHCDRGWWEHNSGAGGVASGVPFPDPVPAERRIVLRSRSVIVGRTSGSAVADVDCGGADTGVSRRHARLTLGADGGWTVTDLGSTNGTFVGDGTTRVEPQLETAFDPAGALRIGAFTVVRLEAAPAAPGEPA